MSLENDSPDAEHNAFLNGDPQATINILSVYRDNAYELSFRAHALMKDLDMVIKDLCNATDNTEPSGPGWSGKERLGVSSSASVEGNSTADSELRLQDSSF